MIGENVMFGNLAIFAVDAMSEAPLILYYLRHAGPSHRREVQTGADLCDQDWHHQDECCPAGSSGHREYRVNLTLTYSTILL